MRVLLAQLASKPRDPEANLETIRSVAAEADAELVAFPELFVSGYQREDLDGLAIAPDGPQVATLREIARSSGTALVIGVAEQSPDRPWNSALCIERDGEVAGWHRKTHLFGSERGAFRSADRLQLVELAGRRVGVMICFELEFPEVARGLAIRGADVLLTISANMEPYGADHDLFSRVRALENNLPHVYVNRVGSESGLRFTGQSRVVGSTGRVIAQAGERERLIAAEVPRPGPRDRDTAYLSQINRRVCAPGPPSGG